MILDDFVSFDGNGLYCRYGDFYLDPRQPVANAVISHAHADHAVSGNANISIPRLLRLLLCNCVMVKVLRYRIV